MTGAGWSTREGHDRADSPRRAELLAAARAVFERLGYGNTNVADITEEAGVGRATFYVYFASKADVFTALAEQVRDSFRSAQQLDGIDESAVLDVIRRTTATTLSVTIDNHRLSTVIEHQALTDPDIERLWHAVRTSAIDRTARYIERVAAAGLAHPVSDPKALATMGSGLNEEFTMQILDGEISREDAVERAVEIWAATLGLGDARSANGGA